MLYLILGMFIGIGTDHGIGAGIGIGVCLGIWYLVIGYGVGIGFKYLECVFGKWVWYFGFMVGMLYRCLFLVLVLVLVLVVVLVLVLVFGSLVWGTWYWYVCLGLWYLV